MKPILFILALLTSIFSYSQSPPPPNGCNVYLVVDDNDDGFALFNVDWYMQSIVVPKLESFMEVDLSNYTPQMYPSENDYNQQTNLIEGPFYTNIIPHQYCYVNFVYSGTGPVLTDEQLYFLGTRSCEILEAVPSNGDFDNDGISNANEDSNGNTYLNDDDNDNDGNINYLDNTNLALADMSSPAMQIFPNPCTGGVLYFSSSIDLENLYIFNLSGQRMKKVITNQNQLSVDFNPGLYILKYTNNGKQVTEKLIVQ
ncbi:MAG TPA: T9SS type A sorting domain-containing protein [Flavobacterium sp.]|jgi:hypothetical protein